VVDLIEELKPLEGLDAFLDVCLWASRLVIVPNDGDHRNAAVFGVLIGDLHVDVVQWVSALSPHPKLCNAFSRA